ncbi:SGNH/GDSL hydrolase family protein, partial [bacterium]|nr:SGNH/GDSL hydrolase family protein [candidate division CSSED10-310 bacterium]
MSLPKRILFSLMALIMILLAVEASLRLWGGTRDDNVLFGNMLQHRALRRDPDLIWSLVPGFDTARVAKPPRHPWPETSYEFTINEHGRRGPAFTMQPGNGSFRVACFGDSTTFSVWVREAETWPRRLEKLCRGAGCPVEVVNCGVPGYSITQGYRDWRLRAAAYGADLVLIGFAGFNGSELRLYSDVERMALLHRYRLVHSWALFDVAARVAVMERRQTMVRRERLSRFITTYRDWIREARAAGCEVAAMIPARQRQVSHQDIPAGVVHNLHELAPLAAAAARAGDREAAARWYRKALEESDLIFERITPEEMPVLVESRVPSPASAMRAVDPVLIELNR